MTHKTLSLFLLLLMSTSFSHIFAQEKVSVSSEKTLVNAEEHNMFDLQGSKAVPSDVTTNFNFKYQIIFEMGGSKAFSSRQKIWLGKDNYWATQDPNIEDTWIVFDVDHKNMILCDNHMKTAQVVNKKDMMNTPNVDVFLERSPGVSNQSNFKKNRRKNKKIAGYKCKAYEYETDDGIITLWINDKIEINNQNLFTSLLPLVGVTNEIPNGLIMEIQSDGVSKLTNMKVINIVEKNENINLNEYKVQERIVDGDFKK